MAPPPTASRAVASLGGAAHVVEQESGRKVESFLAQTKKER